MTSHTTRAIILEPMTRRVQLPIGATPAHIAALAGLR